MNGSLQFDRNIETARKKLRFAFYRIAFGVGRFIAPVAIIALCRVYFIQHFKNENIFYFYGSIPFKIVQTNRKHCCQMRKIKTQTY